ncbi:MAG: adenosine deaminase [Ahrensia sp.]
MHFETHKVLKAEIHCHIEGAAPPSLALVQAQKHGVDISAIVRDGAYVWSDFTQFLKVYDTIAALFRTRADYEALAYAYLSDLAANGTIYSEFFISTDHAIRTGLSATDYIEGLATGIERAERDFGIIARMIATGLRHEGPDAVMGAARTIVDNPHPLVTGWGMAGDERMHHPRDFTAAFDLARGAGLGITVHAGELAGAQSVADALEWLRPTRIGHGVRAIEDENVVETLARQNIVLECCPGSNIALGVYQSFDAHPFRRLMEAGIAVTLNSDDPPHFNTSLAREYDIAKQFFKVDDAILRQCTSTAITAGFIPEQQKQALLKQI